MTDEPFAPTPEQEAALMRMNAAANLGEMEEALDAAVEAGIMMVRVDDNGQKRYSMPKHIADVIIAIDKEAL